LFGLSNPLSLLHKARDEGVLLCGENWATHKDRQVFGIARIVKTILKLNVFKMKKLRFNYLSIFSIKTMLTPFLLVCFLLGFANSSFAQPTGSCMDIDNPDCKTTKQTATVDVAKLWGGTGCQATFSYLERSCPNGVVDFEIIDEDGWEFDFADDACYDRYKILLNTVKAQGTAAIDRFTVDMEKLIGKAALLNSAIKLIWEGNTSDFYCANGNMITGRLYHGPCAFVCTKTVLKEVVNPNGTTSSKKVVTMKKTQCGTTCCYATQSFCLDLADNVVPSGAPKYSSFADQCDKSQSGSNLNCTGLGTILSSCMSACEFNQAKAAPIVDNIQSVDLEKKGENNSIKVNLANNLNTRSLHVVFLNEFEGNISLVDMNGKILFSTQNIKDNSFLTLDYSSFVAGIYVLNFTDKIGNSLSEKIILK
jgi:hypothetical protein